MTSPDDRTVSRSGLGWAGLGVGVLCEHGSFTIPFPLQMSVLSPRPVLPVLVLGGGVTEQVLGTCPILIRTPAEQQPGGHQTRAANDQSVFIITEKAPTPTQLS